MPIKFINKYFDLTKNETYFVISFFVFISSFLAFTFYGPNYNGTSNSVIFKIEKGVGFNKIAENLYVERIIPSTINIKMAAFLFGIEKNIKAGIYEIPDGINYINLLKILNKGTPEEQILVTIQEGIWQKDLVKNLSKKLKLDEKKIIKLCKDEKFIKSLGLNVKSLEGYLLPETYYFYKSSTEEDVLTKLSSGMDKIFEKQEVKSRMKIMKLDKNQILTMASIIDGESNLSHEFKRISGVYNNRLRDRWRLQADPTVQYIVRQKRKKVNRIFYKDLEIDSKYNTYIYYGLPPAPINNPGKEAIMAALYPEQHEYFFFVADGKGGHSFSKTSREHQNQVKRYRKWRRENR